MTLEIGFRTYWCQSFDTSYLLSAGELSVLPNCGHNTYEYFPQEYTRQVLNFYQRHGF